MEIREQAKKDWEKGMKRKDIAKKYGISENTVKSWISRHWNKEAGASKPKKKGAPDKSGSGAKKRGAPQGNQNAKGKGNPAPPGNTYALKHGGYSAVYWDTLDDEEKSLIEDMPKDEETLLIDQIKMLSVRERRLLKIIEKVKQQQGDQVLSYVSRTESKRQFADDAEKELFEERQGEKVAKNDILPGNPYTLTTNTENKNNQLLRLEAELTSVQNAKTRVLSTLSKMNIEKERLALIRDKDDVEVEDTDETDGAIYG